MMAGKRVRSRREADPDGDRPIQGICLICSKPVTPSTQRQGPWERKSSADVLHELAKLLQVSETIYREVNINKIPAQLLCSTCLETLSSVLDLQEHVKGLQAQLQKEVEAIKGYFIRSVHSGDLAAKTGGGVTEVERIRKTYAQCWAPCAVKLRRVKAKARRKPRGKVSREKKTVPCKIPRSVVKDVLPGLGDDDVQILDDEVEILTPPVKKPFGPVRFGFQGNGSRELGERDPLDVTFLEINNVSKNVQSIPVWYEQSGVVPTLNAHSYARPVESGGVNRSRGRKMQTEDKIVKVLTIAPASSFIITTLNPSGANPNMLPFPIKVLPPPPTALLKTARPSGTNTNVATASALVKRAKLTGTNSFISSDHQRTRGESLNGCGCSTPNETTLGGGKEKNLITTTANAEVTVANNKPPQTNFNPSRDEESSERTADPGSATIPTTTTTLRLPRKSKVVAREGADSNADVIVELVEHDKEKEAPLGKRSLQCGECGKIFFTYQVLKQHRYTHTASREFQCAVCGKFYKSRTSLQNHEKIHRYTGDRPYHCEVCEKKFYTATALKRHKGTHLDDRNFNCHICGTLYKTATGLNSHIQTVHQKKRRRRAGTGVTKHIRAAARQLRRQDKKCPICQKIISSNANFARHVELHNGEKDFPCKECPARFPTVPQLILHNRKHNPMYFCKICQISFHYSKTVAHRRDVHGISPAPPRFHCNICSKSYNLRGRYILHMEKHAKPDEVISATITATVDDDKNHISFECKACSKTFVKEAFINSENQLQILCEHENCPCGATFTDFKEFMNHHKKICRFCYFQEFRGRGSKKQYYTCQECGERFSSSGDLTKHMVASHADLRKLSNDGDETLSYELYYKRSRCRVCGKLFRGSKLLKDHENIHNDVRPYECDCGKAFHTARNLTRHQLIHLAPVDPNEELLEADDDLISPARSPHPESVTSSQQAQVDVSRSQLERSDRESASEDETNANNAEQEELMPEEAHHGGIEFSERDVKSCLDSNDDAHSTQSTPADSGNFDGNIEEGEGEDASQGSYSDNDVTYAPSADEESDDPGDFDNEIEREPEVVDLEADDYSTAGDETLPVTSDNLQSELETFIVNNNLDDYDNVEQIPTTEPVVDIAEPKERLKLRKRRGRKSKNPEDRKCPICELVLTKRVKFALHVELHNGEKDFPCQQCPARFPTVPQLVNHNRSYHKAPQRYCRICKQSFPPQTFRDHQRDAHGVAKIEATFDQDQNIVSFECHGCNETFRRESNMTDNNTVQISCQHPNCSCKAVFKNLEQFMNHHKKVCTLLYWVNRPTDSRGRGTTPAPATFICNSCGKTFGRQDILDAHLLIDHAEESKTQSEGSSQETSNSIANGEHHTHMHHHHGSSAFGAHPVHHICEVCGKCFRQFCLLREHRILHENARTFQCHVCGKDFKTKRYLKYHMECHTDAEPSIPCHICGKLFKTATYVRNHIYSTHDKRRPPRIVKRVKTN